MTRDRFSELECFVLGLVWQIGPCSAYDIRQELRGSPSSQWSASAGAIYPLMQRLEKRRLLRSAADARDSRKRRVYSITAGGRSALRSWIGPPMSSDVVTVVHDPLRSRARFLGMLPAKQREAWVKAARDALTQVLACVESWEREHGNEHDPFSELMTRHGEMDVRMRRAWVDEIEQRLRETRPNAE